MEDKQQPGKMKYQVDAYTPFDVECHFKTECITFATSEDMNSRTFEAIDQNGTKLCYPFTRLSITAIDPTK